MSLEKMSELNSSVCYFESGFEHSVIMLKGNVNKMLNFQENVPFNVVLGNYTLQTNGTDPKSLFDEEFGICSALLVTLLIILLISVELTLPYIPFQDVDLSNFLDQKNLKRVITLLILAFAFPFILVFFITAIVYKSVCTILIKRDDKDFVGCLDSFDVFWSLESDKGKSVINVLGIVETDSVESLIQCVKEKLSSIDPKNPAYKIFYRKCEAYGIYYWQRPHDLDLDQYVTFKNLSNYSSKDGLNVKDKLEVIMEVISSDELPFHDKGLFQIIVIDQKLVNDYGLIEYAIIFRVHHSVGDGVALIDFLCKTLGDNNENGDTNVFDSDKRELNNKTSSDLVEIIKTLSRMLICFVDGILRDPDDNIMHGPELSGDRIFKWREGDVNILHQIKDIKKSFGMRFTDILMTALAASIQNFYLKKKSIPDEIAVVLPVRLSKSQNNKDSIVLENDFSVTILDLPIANIGLDEIHSRCNKVRKSADPMANYYFLKIVGGILPRQVLQPLLKSSQATMIFSNMPGPDTINICGENQLKELVFFVPHRGITGLGITALSYGGVLRFGASADKTLISDRDDLGQILEDMVGEIRRLHQELC